MIQNVKTAGQAAKELGLPDGWAVMHQGPPPEDVWTAYPPSTPRKPYIRTKTKAELIEKIRPYRVDLQTELLRRNP